jgi:hypothetical protein
VEVLFAMRVQARILASIPDATPQISDPILIKQRIPQFLREFSFFDESLCKAILAKAPPPSELL